MRRQHFCIPGAHRLTPLAIPGAHDSRMTHAPGVNDSRMTHAPMYIFLTNKQKQKSDTTSEDQLFMIRNFVFGPEKISSI